MTLMPNFLVIGAMKAGTTSLHRYLRQHPDIFMPQLKEPNFFSRQAVLARKGPDAGMIAPVDLEEYRSLFAAARTQMARGEATPIYLCDPRAADEIRRHIPDARLIAILRQPVDRAYSAYLMKCRQGTEPLGFEDALAEEPRRIERGWGFGWHYAGLSRYREQLARYYGHFGPSRVKVVLTDDLSRDSCRVLQELFRFLGVDDSFEPDLSRRHNESFLTRSPSLNRWFTTRSGVRERAKRFLPAMARPIWDRFSYASRRLNWVAPPPLEPAVRARLTCQWDDEIRSLQDFIGRDLSSWRES